MIIPFLCLKLPNLIPRIRFFDEFRLKLLRSINVRLHIQWLSAVTSLVSSDQTRISRFTQTVGSC